MKNFVIRDCYMDLLSQNARSLPMFTYVYLCLPMFTYVYDLPIITYVYLCLPMFMISYIMKSFLLHRKLSLMHRWPSFAEGYHVLLTMSR